MDIDAWTTAPVDGGPDLIGPRRSISDDIDAQRAADRGPDVDSLTDRLTRHQNRGRV
jgi:hypothetical protein